MLCIRWLSCRDNLTPTAVNGVLMTLINSTNTSIISKLLILHLSTNIICFTSEPIFVLTEQIKYKKGIEVEKEKARRVLQTIFLETE